MEPQEIQRLLLIIVFELTTPLVGLNGFCDLLLKGTNSPAIIDQAAIIKKSVEMIQGKKLQLLEITRTLDASIFSNTESTARYLHEFAESLVVLEENISKAVSQIANSYSDESTERLTKDIYYLSNQYKRLNIVIQSIKTVKPNLEIENL
jgi:signal transduction histidine kinase